VCTPLMVADLEHIDAAGLNGFNVGFRCKSLTVCSPEQNCIYYGERLGSVHSSETTYTDGAMLTSPAAVKVRIDLGAASQCGNPPITLAAGESITLKFDGGRSRRVFFPAFSGTSLTLYVREDGATCNDAALTQVAQKPL
jgi:hypothetical protein